MILVPFKFAVSVPAKRRKDLLPNTRVIVSRHRTEAAAWKAANRLRRLAGLARMTEDIRVERGQKIILANTWRLIT